MSKPEILPASEREKERYVVFEVLSDNQVDFDQIVETIWHTVLHFYGEETTSRINFWIMKDLWDQEDQKGVIKCNYRYSDHVKLALSLLTRVGDIGVIFNTLGESGTLKTVKDKYM